MTDLPAILGAPTPLPPTPGHPGRGARSVPAAASGSLRGFPNPLPLRLEKQGGENWCWAAVTIGIARLYNASVESRQCRFVTKAFGKSPSDHCCGSDPPTDECDRPSSLDVALDSVECFADGANAAPFATLQREINQGRVVGVRIERPTTAGHFMAVSGWKLGPAGQEVLIVNDPADGTVKEMRYTDLVHSREGDWTDTTFTRRPPAGNALAPPARAPRIQLLGG
ncbi:MAG TPA: hypothetical protein VF605_08850 [Allosphingosinicella sp.]